jgi:hypothetical protein
MAKGLLGPAGVCFLFVVTAVPALWAQEEIPRAEDVAAEVPDEEEIRTGDNTEGSAEDSKRTQAEEDGKEAEEPIDPSLYNTIVHVMPGEVIFLMSPETSAAVGDLYELVREDENIGLLMVNEVQEKIAVARVVTSDEDPLPGDKVRESGRAGIEATFYGGAFLKDNFSSSYMPIGGLRLVLARWFYYTRPALEIGTLAARAHPELQLTDTVPFNILAGAEITNLYMGRFQLGFIVLAGLGWSYLNEDAAELFSVNSGVRLRHAAGKVFVSLGCLLDVHIKLTADAGILALIDRRQTFSDVNPAGYFGRKVAPFVTLGLTIR